MAKYGVYIIESLNPGEFCDGKKLSEILKLSGIKAKHKSVKDKEEFRQALQEFGELGYRYLHISCHANMEGFGINKDFITNNEFQNYSQEVVKNKRVFFSACEAGNRDIAKKLICRNEAYSILGVPTKLRFDKAAIFWPAFYHLMNENDDRKMVKDNIIETVKSCVDLFDVPMNYYGKIKDVRNKITRYKIRKGKYIEKVTITI